MAELHCRVTPNAKQDEVLGWEEDAAGREVLRIKIKAPPVEGKANKHLLAFVSSWLGLRKSQFAIGRGDKSRVKTLDVSGLEPEELRARIDAALQ